ncbi:MAG: hypothetical protein LUG50_10180, partial [Planctomycetaceae bacterium]|nr:hypothetical protein [Planctomycetaceae bacterium]
MTHSRSWFQPFLLAGCLALAGLAAVADAARAEDCPDCPAPNSGAAVVHEVVVNEHIYQKDPDTFVDIVPSRVGPGTLPFAITPDEPVPVFTARTTAATAPAAPAADDTVVIPPDIPSGDEPIVIVPGGIGAEDVGVPPDATAEDGFVVRPDAPVADGDVVEPTPSGTDGVAAEPHGIVDPSATVTDDMIVFQNAPGADEVVILPDDSGTDEAIVLPDDPAAGGVVVLRDAPVTDGSVLPDDAAFADGSAATILSAPLSPDVLIDDDGVIVVPAPAARANGPVVVVPARPNGAVSPFLLDVPTLSELRKPVEEAPVIEDAPPEAPVPVVPEQRRTSLADYFPDDPFWYAEVADAEQARRQWADSPPGRLLAEPALEQTFRNNRFGLDLLFSDLPASVIDAARVSSIATALDLADPLAASAHSLAGAAYLGDDGVFRFLFLMDIGLDREPAFDIMSRWETTFHLAYPGSNVIRGNRRDRQYLDVITVRGSSRMRPAEIALGFIDNLAVVSNDPLLARRAIDLALAGPGSTGSVAASRYGRRLAASRPAATDTAAVGFFRIDSLLDRLDGTAREAVRAWADFIGHGGRDGEALYYGLTLDPDAVRETLFMPAQGTAASSSLLEVVARRLRPAARWTVPAIMPYQPSPTLFFAGMMEGRQLGGILRQERRLFGMADEEYFLLPAAGRRLFTNDLLAVLSGEFGLGFYPGPEGEAMWLLVLPCTENPESFIPRAASRIDRANAVISSQDSNWRTALTWTTLSSDQFRGLGGHFLVIASQGELVLSAIDQMVAGSSLMDNRDFTRAMAAVEADPGLVFYLNLPEIVIRQYPNFSSLMRSYYPRSSGFNSRPPLSLLRRYAEGIVGSVPTVGRDDEFIRLAVRGPV